MSRDDFRNLWPGRVGREVVSAGGVLGCPMTSPERGDGLFRPAMRTASLCERWCWRTEEDADTDETFELDDPVRRSGGGVRPECSEGEETTGAERGGVK